MTEQTLLDGFVDESPPDVPVLDRSTAERYAACPHQGWWLDHNPRLSGNDLTDVGNEVHAILSQVVKARHLDAVRPAELYELVKELAFKSRPDVQPQVIEATRRAFPIVNLLCYHGEGERAPDDILRYDGGAGQHAGQLASDLAVGEQAVRLTAELDLLIAGASVEEVELTDWKSGWKHWTATAVRDSFQFQFYALLVFLNYPGVNRVNVSIVMTRDGERTSPVTFDRARHLYAIRARVISAARLFLQYHAARGPEDVDAWPSPAKCSTCDAATVCLRANLQTRELAADPEGYLRDYAAGVARVDQMKAALTTAVRVRGRDLNFGDVAFGIEKPVARRAPACDLYEPRKGVAS